jgi:hypothetical protein
MRKHFTSLLKEETARGTDLISLYLALSTYFTSKALTYKSSTFKSCILSSLITLIRVITLAITLEYKCIQLTFAATLILDLASSLALNLTLSLTSSLTLSLLTISFI